MLEYSMNIKLLTEHLLKFLNLKGGCTRSSDSTLVKMPHCWKSLVVPHITYMGPSDALQLIFLILRSTFLSFMERFDTFQTSDTSTMTVQVENLSPYTTYQLRLIAENDVGRSDPSSPTRDFMTLKTVPEIAPRNVAVISVGATAFRVSWLVSLAFCEFSSIVD